MENREKRLKQLLEEHHSFPTRFLYSFVCPKESLKHLCQVFEKCEMKQIPSRTGKYVRVRIEKLEKSSENVIETYKRCSVIDGLISL